MASTPVRKGVVASLRFSAAAGPAVGVGTPAETWLNRVGLPRAGAVDQPYWTPRLVVRGRRALPFSVMRIRGIEERHVVVEPRCKGRVAAQRADIRGAMVAGSFVRPLLDWLASREAVGSGGRRGNG